MSIYEQARSPERVWKYNWAISQAAGVTDELADFTSEAEAAMTLADAEIEKGIALMREKVADARAESARLRLELEDARSSLKHSLRVAEFYAQETRKHLAVVERVRAVLDRRERLDDPDSRHIAAELRAALEGESNV